MNKEELVKDPVCGMVGSKTRLKYTSVYNGKVYYFCSEMDKEIFDKYPDRWAGGDKQ